MTIHISQTCEAEIHIPDNIEDVEDYIYEHFAFPSDFVDGTIDPSMEKPTWNSGNICIHKIS